MTNALVIVESPAKAKTIEKFLGGGFKVLASYGHVRSIPSKKGSVDIEKDFEPKYAVIENKQKYIDIIEAEIKKGVDEIYLATDLDREGEAIAWHLTVVLGIDNGNGKVTVHRIRFSEITQSAISDAVKNPEKISKDLVNAQRAREILDYLVGFNLSPFLWKKVKFGLSAGRVQSVALRMICEREKEIEAFDPEEFWTITGIFTDEGRYDPFSANLISVKGEKLDKFDIASEKKAVEIIDDMTGLKFSVGEIRRRDTKRSPYPPYITSTLQQDASNKLGFTAKRTMDVAQKLYTGKEVNGELVGLITYMRTDSNNIAESALAEAKEVIEGTFGDTYSLKSPRRFAKKVRGAQEAHEAIRPTSFKREPKSLKKFLTREEYRLYDLIWKRALASQMTDMILDSISVDIVSERGDLFRTTGSTVKFPGFSKVYPVAKDDEAAAIGENLKKYKGGEPLSTIGFVPEQHYTAPPPRYNEASLIRALEEHGIGRPSTYAGIINTLKTRKYVRIVDRRFFPEDVGMIVSDLLVNHFNRYVDYEFTAHMEEDLDNIAGGKMEWLPMIKDFWGPFNELLDVKDREVRKEDVYNQKTDKTCPECGKPVLIKLGKFGRFYACSGYPDCRYVAPLEGREEEVPETDEICEKCGKPMQVKKSKYGYFLGCTGYPECKFNKPIKAPFDTEVTCPECGKGTLVEREGKTKRSKGMVFYGCSRFPKCNYTIRERPYPEPCPKCGAPFVVLKTDKDGTKRLECIKDNCDHSEEIGLKDLERLEKRKSA
ncbi:MAG: type I DNA topoisomerase [Deltaproteobacteria bacterium]|uniref:DNA topoisomerase 1 n=1 Tax=Candidatus Zymogenus saltonus TaxID=2844893 RepID=A0A9D8PP43_9DELT|nr:type I DNA topoisomerase [Candidatus Zymogenus saltonus]